MDINCQRQTACYINTGLGNEKAYPTSDCKDMLYVREILLFQLNPLILKVISSTGFSLNYL